MESVGQLLSILLMLAVAVAAAVGIALFYSEYLHRQTPKGGDLAITGAEALYDPQSNSIMVSVSGYYQGAEEAKLEGVYVVLLVENQSSGSGGGEGGGGGSGSGLYVYVCPSYTLCPIISGCVSIPDPSGCVLACTQPITPPSGCTLVQSPSTTTTTNPPSGGASYGLVELNMTAKVGVEAFLPGRPWRMLLTEKLDAGVKPIKATIIVSYCFSNGCSSATYVCPVAES